MTGPRPYGYRFREDRSLRPLGGEREPLYEVDAPAAVADATARAAGVSVPPTTLERTASGLLFYDQFTRADGGLGADWTTFIGTWAIAGNRATVEVANGGIVATGGATSYAEQDEQVVQAVVIGVLSTLQPALRAKWDGTTNATSWGYVLQLNNTNMVLSSQSGTSSLTQVQASAAISNALAAGVVNELKLAVKAGSQRAWRNGTQLIAAANAVHDARTGRGGLRIVNNHTTPQTQPFDNFAVYSANRLTVRGLEAGMRVRLTPGGVTVATGVSVTIDLAGTMCPLQTIEVLDAEDTVLKSLTPATGIWGGDEYEFSGVGGIAGVTATAQASDRIRVGWTAYEYAQGYRVSMHTGDGVWATLADVPREATFYDHTGLAEATTRYYRVQPIVSGELASPSSAVSATTPLAAPTGLTATPSVGSIALAWTDASALEASYVVQRAVGSGAWADLAVGLAAGTQAYTDLAPDADDANRYRVAAVSGTGTRSYSSEVSVRRAAGGSLVRTLDGLLYRDQFTRADGALGADWTFAEGGAVWALASEKARVDLTPGQRASSVLAAIAGRIALVVQATVGRIGTNVWPGFWAKLDPATGDGYYVQFLATNLNLNRAAGWAGSGLGSINTGAVGGTVKVEIAAGLQRVHFDGQTLERNNAVLDAVAGKGGLYGDSTTGTAATTADDFAVCRSNEVIVRGMPAGFKVRTGTLLALEFAGSATIECGASMFPFEYIELLDATDTIRARLYPEGGVWGGDEYEVGSVDPEAPPPIDTIPVGIGPAGVYGGVAVGFSVYHTATMSNGVRGFTSQDGTTASVQMSVTFDKPLRMVRLTCQDPTWAGNTLEALDALGNVLATATFDHNGTPGTNTPSTKEVQASGIRSIRLTPAADDFVSYSALVIAE